MAPGVRILRLGAVLMAALPLFLFGCGRPVLLFVQDEAWDELAEFPHSAYRAIAEDAGLRLREVTVPMDVSRDDLVAASERAKEVMLSPLLYTRYGSALGDQPVIGVREDTDSLNSAWEAAGRAAADWVDAAADRTVVVLHEGDEVLSAFESGLGETPRTYHISGAARRASDIRNVLRETHGAGDTLVVATSTSIALDIALGDDNPLLLAPFLSLSGYPGDRVFGEIARELSSHAVLVYEYRGY